MPITEIALLGLLPGASIDDVHLRSKLARAKSLMQNYTGRSFYYFQQLEDPSQLYIFGEWDSLEQHMEDFIPGPENQAILALLKDDLGVEWLQHIDTPHTNLSLPKTDAQKTQALEGQLMWNITRHWVKDGCRESFTQALSEGMPELGVLATEGISAGGWRVDKENGKDEFVMLSPWKSMEQCSEVVDPETAEWNGEMTKYTDRVEVRHMRLLDI
ncbi:hypothetical protein ACN47E_002671 [Coniothyrium glycines]